MRPVTVLVIDGFGIGAMPDAGTLRPGDARADTLGSVCRWSVIERTRPLAVANLAGAGLTLLRADLAAQMAPPQPTGRAVARRVGLGYPGADTFAGHQTMMGADMSHVVLCRLAERLDDVATQLRTAGHSVELLEGSDGQPQPVLLVDGQALVHDNLEADPALNWNVSADTRQLSFPDILSIAKTVREIAPVARVIAVGGHADGPVGSFVRPGEQGTVGFDTPASGFYRNGDLQVQHLGADLDHRRQLPEVAALAGIEVTLVGKAADILATDAPVRRLPGVQTSDVLRDTAKFSGSGLVVSNVQQTDLAGHQQDVQSFAARLEQVDSAIPGLLRQLGPGGVLIVTGDHGNDPLVGHAFHTREYVPALVVETGAREGPRLAPDLPSLADLGASVALLLGLRVSLASGSGVDLLGTTTTLKEQE